MYKSLKGKKLLVIGSDSSNISIVEEAQDMGVYVVVTDGITDITKAPAKKAADEYWNIDYSDIDAIAKKCTESNINGVFAGYSEFRVMAACKIAKRLGLPFYANEEQIDLTRNKRKFKDACSKYGIPIPKDYCFSYPMNEDDKKSIEYPVIVKPADYAGRKGISVCNNLEELNVAVEYAAKMSQSKTIIVEDYLNGLEFSSVYTAKNGEISLSCVNEKYITDDQDVKTGLCEFLISPAKSLDRYKKELDNKVRSFMEGIQIKNGVIFFQGMVTENKIYIFEMGYRINGNNDFRVIDKINGINFMKMMIAYSLCGDMCDDIAKDNPNYNKFACTLLFYAHAGVINKFEVGNIYNNPNISDVVERAWIGREISEDGSTGQSVLTLKIFADTLEEVIETIKFAQTNIIVEDEKGNNILFKPFDAKKLVK